MHGTHLPAHDGGVLVPTKMSNILISEHQQQPVTHVQLCGQHGQHSTVRPPAAASKLLRHMPAGRGRHAEHADPRPVREGYRQLQP